MPDNKVLFGDATDETIIGMDGADVISGGYGDDVIDGSDGNDTLDGGRGSDLLIGGAGDDTIVLDSDGGEPQVDQNFDPNDGRNDEIDPVTRTVYTNQPIVGDDIAIGGAGADTFLVKPQISAKADIMAKHTDDDGWIDWADVAGENNNAHDHWVDRFGRDTILDYNEAEGDRILLWGHTADIESITYQDVDGDGDLESIVEIRSNQGGNGGAHDGDYLGTLIVHGDRVEEDDIDVEAGMGTTFGVVDTIFETNEVINPDGVLDTEPEDSVTSLSPLAQLAQDILAGIEPSPAEVAGAATPAEAEAAEDAPAGPAAIDNPISFWSFTDNNGGVFSDATGVSSAAYYLQDDNQGAVLQTGLIPMIPDEEGNMAPLFGVTDDSFAYIAHNEAFEVENATFSAWFNPADLGGSQTILAKDNRNQDDGGHFHIKLDGEKLFVRVAEGDGDIRSGYNHEWRTKDNVIDEGNWHHVALTFGSDGVKIYLNGELLSDDDFNTVGGRGNLKPSEFTGGYITNNDNALIIGANTRVSDETSTAELLGAEEDLTQFFEGAINNVGFWGGATPADTLSDAQIMELYESGVGDLAYDAPADDTADEDDAADGSEDEPTGEDQTPPADDNSSDDGQDGSDDAPTGEDDTPPSDDGSDNQDASDDTGDEPSGEDNTPPAENDASDDSGSDDDDADDAPTGEDDSADAGDDSDDGDDELPIAASALEALFTPEEGASLSNSPTGQDDYLVIAEDDSDIRGRAGDDLIFGNELDNIIRGDNGDDAIDGGEGDDTSLGGKGNDTIRDLSGDNDVRAGHGDDAVLTGDGDDSIRTGKGHDVAASGAGDDDIRLGQGDDIAKGDAGSDDIRGGAGTDTAIYDGALSDYTITFNGGRISVENADGDVDTLRSIEQIHFAADGETYATAGRELTLLEDDSDLQDKIADELIAELLGLQAIDDDDIDLLADLGADADDAAEEIVEAVLPAVAEATIAEDEMQTV